MMSSVSVQQDGLWHCFLNWDLCVLGRNVLIVCFNFDDNLNRNHLSYAGYLDDSHKYSPDRVCIYKLVGTK